MLRCADGSYHVGSTRQPIEARLWEHNNLPLDGYTSTRRPVVLVLAESCDSIIDAVARERQIKGWSRRKKEALIVQAYEALPALCRRMEELTAVNSRLGLPRQAILVVDQGEAGRGLAPPPQDEIEVISDCALGIARYEQSIEPCIE